MVNQKRLPGGMRQPATAPIEAPATRYPNMKGTSTYVLCIICKDFPFSASLPLKERRNYFMFFLTNAPKIPLTNRLDSSVPKTLANSTASLMTTLGDNCSLPKFIS